MVIDVTSFGYGVGLVLLGWGAGLGVSFVFTIIDKIGTMGGR